MNIINYQMHPAADDDFVRCQKLIKKSILKTQP